MVSLGLAMKIYFAGTPGQIKRERRWLEFITKRLLSFWDIQQDQFGVPESFNLIKEMNNVEIKHK